MKHRGTELTQTNETKLVVTLPVYKDTQFLSSTVSELEDATKPQEKNFILLIAEDGSNSSGVVDGLRGKYGNILHFQNDQRLGRGKALREAWRKVQADVYVYVDVDLATDLKKFDAYQNLIQLQGQFDLVTGSRYVPGSTTNRPTLRRTASVAYNWMVRLLFQTGVHDHQCGFKSFSRRLIDRLNVEARSNSWFWDTEVIVLARRMGFSVKEIQVDWVEMKGKRTPLRRLMRDIWLHGSGLVSLFYRVYFTDLPGSLS